MKFIIELKRDGAVGGQVLSLTVPMEADNMSAVLAEAKKAVDSGIAEEAVVYQPVRMIRACRKVEVIDMPVTTNPESKS